MEKKNVGTAMRQADDYIRRLRNIYIGHYLRSDTRPAKVGL
jgi:hypothetical protein